MNDNVFPSSRKILIVDDNRIMRHLLKMTFISDTRYQLLEAASGEQCLPIVVRELPDLVLLDVMMPGELDGLGICRMIKSWPDLRHCKVILLSAKTQQEDLDAGKAAGADDYVTKPFSPDKLLKLVDDLFK